MHYSYSRAILAPSRVLVRDVLFVVDLWLSSLLHFHRHSSLFITADNEKRPIDVALNPIEFLLFKLSTQFQIWRRRFKVKLSKSFFFCIFALIQSPEEAWARVYSRGIFYFSAVAWLLLSCWCWVNLSNEKQQSLSCTYRNNTHPDTTMMLMSEDSWKRVNDAGRRFCPAIIGRRKEEGGGMNQPLFDWAVRFLRATPFQSFSRSMSHIVPTAAPVDRRAHHPFVFNYNKNTHTPF